MFPHNTTTKTCKQCGKALNVPKFLSWTRVFCDLECQRNYVTGRPRGNRDTEKIFWSLVEIRGEDDCWIFNHSLTRGGYGRYSFYGKVVTAHRVAWILTHGDITSAEFVLHDCDVRNCCNPKHLFLGDSQANVDDMHNKGRARKARGEDASHAKLTEAQVSEIRRLYNPDKRNGVELARQYNISSGTLYAIISGKTWKHTL